MPNGREAPEIERLRRENARLRERIAEQAKQLAEQAKQIADLKRQLALRQQNSTLTSKPPSADGLAGGQRERGRRTRSRRNGDIGNDFGVVAIPAALASLVRPEMPVFGGPGTVQDVSLGQLLCHYGNGVGVGEVFLTMARVGIGGGSTANSWMADLAGAPRAGRPPDLRATRRSVASASARTVPTG